MKYCKLLLLCILVSFKIQAQQKQEIFAADFHKYPDTCVIFVGALWCLPCVEKQYYLEQFREKYPDFPYFVLMDHDWYSDERYERIFQRKPDMNFLKFIHQSYYKDKNKSDIIVRIDPFHFFKLDLQKQGFKFEPGKKGYYGMLLFKNGKNIEVFRYDAKPYEYVLEFFKRYNIEMEITKKKKIYNN